MMRAITLISSSSSACRVPKMATSDFLIPNTEPTKVRLEDLLVSKEWYLSDRMYVMSERQAKALQKKLQDEGFDCDWGACSGKLRKV